MAPILEINPETCRSYNRLIAGDQYDKSRMKWYGHRMNDQHIITLDPNKRSGKPTIRGLRITVYDILSYLASGMTAEQVLADFPELTKEDIQACLSYAAQREQSLLFTRT